MSIKYINTEQKDKLTKFDYIDLLRGIAILGVLAVHVQQYILGLHQITSAIFNYGQLGVQLFFVASALTLCHSMCERNEKTVRNFYIRRFFRIAPLYYFGIVLYFILRVAKEYYKTNELNIPSEYSVIAIFENLLFLHGFDPRNFNFIVPGGWSIATEMTFYAIFPILFSIQYKYGFKKFAHITVCVMLLSFAVQFFSIEIMQPHLMKLNVINNIEVNDGFGFVHCSIINQINVFMIGILVYLKLKDNQPISNVTLVYAAVLCFVSCYLLNTEYLKTGYNGYIYPILSSIAFGIFSIRLSTVSGFNNAPSQALIKIGQVSFSMYLLHFLVLDVIAFVLKKVLFNFVPFPEIQLVLLFCGLVSITYFAARFTYVSIEKPAINFGRRYIQ